MPQTARTFRIFVSPTFSDLRAERNALQARVFPRLRELAEAHACRFQVIDLRTVVHPGQECRTAPRAGHSARMAAEAAG